MAVVDPDSRRLIGKPIAVESGASAIVADPAHDRLYTANTNGTISVVDTMKKTAEKVSIGWSG
jgi:DNA-binding beta-propeller fold protein YncE